MSKSSQSTNFRKVNVDELDEERFQDDTGESAVSTGPSEGEIQNLLNGKNNASLIQIKLRKKNGEALNLLLKNPPYNAGKEDKAQRFSLVIRVLSQFKSNEIDGVLKTLSTDDIDVLLKFIYRGFSEPSDSTCSILLTWHEKIVSSIFGQLSTKLEVVAVSGLGSIIRVMTDRKSI